jgi:hypothetical protein
MALFVSCYPHQLVVTIREVSLNYFGGLLFLGSADFSKLSKKLNEFDKPALHTAVQFSPLHQITERPVAVIAS